MLRDKTPRVAQKKSEKGCATIRCIACHADCILPIGRLVATRNTLIVECPRCKRKMALEIEARRLTPDGD